MQRGFPREAQMLAGVFELVAEFCAGNGIDTSIQRDLDLILEELFTNAVRHNPDGRGELSIELDRDGNAVRVVLIDPDADRFDPTELPAPDLGAPLEERKPGGLGIHLIRQLSEEFRYEYLDRTAKTIVTVKLG